MPFQVFMPTAVLRHYVVGLSVCLSVHITFFFKWEVRQEECDQG